ncbi:Zinc knuckle, partial [Trichostrongylus colubriformis]
TTMEVDDSEVTEQRAEPRRERLLADTDIAAIIAALREDQPSSSKQVTAPTPSFVRKGYGSQYEFNTSLLQKLSRLNRAGLRKEDEEIIQATVEMINVRNETLKIADKHPGVFSFLEGKKQAEAVKSSDPFLSEFLEQVQKEEKRTNIKKKRSFSPVAPSRPFPGRESAWRPDPRPSRYTPRSKTYVTLDRPRYRNSFASRTPYQRFSRDKAEGRRSPCFLCGHEGHWRDECPNKK